MPDPKGKLRQEIISKMPGMLQLNVAGANPMKVVDIGKEVGMKVGVSNERKAVMQKQKQK